jgi:hypothetical protein
MSPIIHYPLSNGIRVIVLWFYALAGGFGEVIALAALLI